jgi:SAM-dependent methyltransferase
MPWGWISRPRFFARPEARLPGCHRVRGDMRHLPFTDGSFDLVTSFFTSFGYFDSDDEDVKVLARGVPRAASPMAG